MFTGNTEEPMSSTLELTILSRDADVLRRLVETHALAGLTITQCDSDLSKLNPEHVQVLLGDPNLAADIVPQCHHLTWCQSTWAGNTPLLALDKTDYRLTGVKGIFGEQMREYVFAYLLYFARNIETFNAQQHRPPLWNEASTTRLAGKTLGILGAGSIARAVAPVAHAFGMRVIGLKRNGESEAGFDAIYPPSGLTDFAAQCQAVVNLLPDTPETENTIDSAFLNALPDDAILINAGRGSAIAEDALIGALDRGKLRAAVLDVFREEPLPDTHPFWDHPNIYVTAHTAAISRPEDVVAVFIDNARRFQTGQALHYQFEFERGY